MDIPILKQLALCRLFALLPHAPLAVCLLGGAALPPTAIPELVLHTRTLVHLLLPPLLLCKPRSLVGLELSIVADVAALRPAAQLWRQRRHLERLGGVRLLTEPSTKIPGRTEQTSYAKTRFHCRTSRGDRADFP